MTKRASLALDFSIIVGYSVFILAILCTPNLRPPRFFKFPHSDKVIHACQFAVLSFLLFRFFLRHYCGMGWFWIFTASVLITAVYGGAIELIQKTVPGRTTDWADAAADTAGAILAASIFLLAIAGKKRSQTALQRLTAGQKEKVL